MYFYDLNADIFRFDDSSTKKGQHRDNYGIRNVSKSECELNVPPQIG